MSVKIKVAFEILFMLLMGVLYFFAPIFACIFLCFQVVVVLMNKRNLRIFFFALIAAEAAALFILGKYVGGFFTVSAFAISIGIEVAYHLSQTFKSKETVRTWTREKIFVSVTVGSLMGICVLLSSIMGASAFSKKDFNTLSRDYVLSNPNILVTTIAKIEYDGEETASTQAAVKYFADEVAKKADYLPYYIVLIITLSSFAAVFTLVKTDRGKPSEIRLNRKYILYVALPTLAVSVIGFYPPALPFTSAISLGILIIPSYACSVTLMLSVIERFSKKRWRIVLYITVSLIVVSSLTFSPVMLVLSAVGFADALLDIRKLLDYALDGKSLKE